MNHEFDHRLLSLLILTGLVLLGIPNCVCQIDPQYETCRQPFQCGNISEIGYPFWGGDRPESCGYPGFQLICRGDILLLNINSLSYRVLAVNNRTQTLRVSRDDLSNTLCPRLLFNTTLNFNLFDFSSAANDQNVTLYYGCGLNTLPLPTPTAPNQFNCDVNGTNSWSFYLSRDASGLGNGVVCSSNISVPVNQAAAQALANPTTTTTRILQDALANGFWIQWSAENDNCNICALSGGLCGHNLDSGSFACYCTNGTREFTCNDSGNGNGTYNWILYRSKKGLFDQQKYVIIGVSLGLASIVISSIIIFCKRKQCRLRKPHQESNENVDKFLLNHGSLAPKRYNYNEIKKITKSFTEKLGQGGYGIVYKGKLPDGRLVAVKLLTATGDNAEEFVNEVASISRTSHVNIVNLLGFCYDRKKRALVYEFMPNKSLDKFISKSGSNGPDRELDWEKLYEIAVGVARGLEYLHRGCNTRIVHFDIKPQNILLDEDFCPKISDFGLAKLFKKKQSIISMLGARGTIGYIAPEVFSRNFGAVSHKSDVYSYGMMLLEMAGAKKIIEIEGIQSSENYFPDKIYEHVLLKNEKLDDLVTDENEETARKMLLIGLWCIQTAPSDRPSMTKVVEMSEGSLQSIQIPPKPILSSPMLPGPQFSSSFSATVEIDISVEG
ncbi:hypothetical protein DH2020_015945 [Rehmannia glutinosa]|uniref:non-specific serine/threonine protein kinase n=1 Tax=Rehmannia glutinosa TaxID=99300 RepID=A0ABR0WU33_REHGL